MKVPRRQVAEAISRISDSELDKQRLAEEIAAYLLDEQRVDDLDSIMRDVMEERGNRGIVEVSAVSAHDIGSQVVADIKDEIIRLYPEAQQIIVNVKKDPSVLGGVRLEFANAQLDLSLRAKLNRLKYLITYRKDKVSV